MENTSVSKYWLSKDETDRGARFANLARGSIGSSPSINASHFYGSSDSTPTDWVNHSGGVGKQTAVPLSDIQQRLSILEAASRSRMVVLASLAHASYKLKRELFVEVDSSGSEVTAHSVELEEFGQGETEYEALSNLRRALCETFDFLIANKPKLGADLQDQLARFVDLIEVR